MLFYDNVQLLSLYLASSLFSLYKLTLFCDNFPASQTVINGA